MTVKAYIGTKVIVAAPQEKDGQPGYRVVYPDGYASWSPKGTFEQAYREVSTQEADAIQSPDLLFATSGK